MTRRIWPLAFGIAALTGCADRQPPTAPPEQTAREAMEAQVQAEATKAERVARRFARALHDPDFRAYVRTQLDVSPFPEHKIQLQRFLQASDRRALRSLARETRSTEEQVDEEARSAQALEVYFPVPEHRSRWSGDEHVLVATAQRDRDVPVAFDVGGGRHLLSPDRPPQTPVLAVVPVETDFDAVAPPRLAPCVLAPGTGPAGIAGQEGCGSGGFGTVPPPPGLFMTSAHFTQSFEGWLKGDPEFEIHIMGQAGTTDSLSDYQCIGEKVAAPYFFDQNSLDWTGNVMLFSQVQIDTYKGMHPGQSFRIMALEDDDTACQIKVDQADFKAIVGAVGPVYRDITGAIDTITTAKVLKAAKSLQNFLSSVASWILTNDDLIGNAIEDKVAIEFHPGANWVFKGANNTTTGWAKFEMK